jgi:hypothetical protein
MTAATTKRALGLQLGCGDLALAISIDEIDRVVLATDLRVHAAVDGQPARVELEGEDAIPAWDLAQLLGAKRPSSMRTWIIVQTEVGGAVRRFALGCDRSTAVQPLALDLPLPPGLFAKRAGAVKAAFITTSTTLAPTGYVLTAAHLICQDELAAAGRAASQGTVRW